MIQVGSNWNITSPRSVWKGLLALPRSARPPTRVLPTGVSAVATPQRPYEALDVVTMALLLDAAPRRLWEAVPSTA